MSNFDQLKKLLQDGSLEEQREAAKSLMHAGESAIEAVAELVRAADTDDEILCEFAHGALECVGAPPESAISELQSILEEIPADSKSSSYWAATMLGRMGNVAKDALPELAKASAKFSEIQVQQRILWAIDKIGPDESVVPVLTAYANNQNPRLARIANQALSKCA